ncbi:hypothetical protein FK535_25455 [Mycolicibacterium sp. 018/SC-01/001]|uniref:hypothetical protein n=1 Tax=Mycolicibacterium sp. 018/SC-01/001 TaxID=2592069 RepID=UPI00117C991B|nr:hypothetical protein [Mycolicibacterium sp. 018/SC-01/001]TRW78434.1 hypothetical protein FK535_25455 [Mycolicibacterium sp. 018/SC-01/001]
MGERSRLVWPIAAAAVSAVGGVMWSARRRSAGGRHEMPDLPGAHEDGTVHVTPEGEVRVDPNA